MVGKDLLKEIALDQRSTILNKEPGIRRYAMDRIVEIKDIPHAVVITGIRRCGKSTFLRQIIREHLNDEDCYYINFGDERLRGFRAENFNDIYETQISLFGKKVVFLIDEIQNPNGFESFVRRFKEMGFRFYITGSNANLLSREIGPN